MKNLAGVLGTLALFFFLSVIFIQPLRDYMNSLFHRADFMEERIIGTVSTYNPRVREIQVMLTDAKYYDDVEDGLMGEKTRVALKAFQEARGLKPSGRIDEDTFLALNRMANREPAVETLRPVAPEQRQAMPPAPVSAEVRQPAVAMDSPAVSAPQSAKKASGVIPAPNDWFKKIQVALKKAGYYNGTVDGKPGAATIQAIKSFQKANGLKADGVVGALTWEKLKTIK